GKGARCDQGAEREGQGAAFDLEALPFRLPRPPASRQILKIAGKPAAAQCRPYAARRCSRRSSGGFTPRAPFCITCVYSIVGSTGAWTSSAWTVLGRRRQ